MGTITVNVDDAVERQFRRKALARYGKRKGALGEALKEAMSNWAQQQEHADECLRLLDEGVDLGGLRYASREEIHYRT